MYGMSESMSWQQIAKAFDVPPWIMNPAYPVPRFPRLRWALRRFWPVKERNIPMQGALQMQMDKSLYGFCAMRSDGSRIDPSQLRGSSRLPSTDEPG